MFDAARTALIAKKTPVQAEEIRSHSGLISAFSLHLVKTGQVPVELGRALNKVEELRIIADYRGDSVDREKAEWAVNQAKDFVEFLRRLISA